MRDGDEGIATGKGKVDDPNKDGHYSNADDDSNNEKTKASKCTSDVVDFNYGTGNHEADTDWSRPRMRRTRVVYSKSQKQGKWSSETVSSNYRRNARMSLRTTSAREAKNSRKATPFSLAELAERPKTTETKMIPK